MPKGSWRSMGTLFKPNASQDNAEVPTRVTIRAPRDVVLPEAIPEELA